MSWEEAKAQSDAINAEVDAASAALDVFPKGAMNLTPDDVKASPDYRAAKARYDKAFAKLRAFNASFVKKYKKELRAERDAKRAGRLGIAPLDPTDFDDHDEFTDKRDEVLGHLQICAASTRIGHRNENISWAEPQTHEVCLTPTQVKHFFKSRAGVEKADRLGCGTFACAWKVGDKAVKITTDGDDVEAIKNAQDLKHVVKFFDARELPESGENESGDTVPVYAMRVELLSPIDEAMAQAVAELPNFYKPFYDYFGGEIGSPDESYALPQNYKDAALSSCDWLGDDDAEQGACKKFVREITDTVEALGKKGINAYDLHEGNFGVDKKGVWKLLDIGISGGGQAPDIEILRGLGAGGEKIKGAFCESHVTPRSAFAPKSFRWTRRAGRDGDNWILTGCPKGKWDEAAQACSVGTRAYKVLTPAPKGGRCKRGRSKIKKP